MLQISKNLFSIIRNSHLFNEPKPILLGRWSYVNCEKTLSQKIERSNIDHCGPCGDNSEILKLKNNNIVKNNLVKK